MQRQRNIFDMFPETVDLNQGPSFNGLDMTGSDECNSRLSPTERLLLNNDISGERNKSQSYSSWDVGESSSRPNVQNHVANNNNNNNRSTSYGTHDSRLRERQFVPHRVIGSSSNNVPMDVDLNLEYRGNNSNDERGSGSSFGQSSAVVNSRQPTNSEISRRYFDQRSTNSSQRSTQQPPPLMHVPVPRNLPPFPLTGNQDNRNVATWRSNRNGVNGQSSSLRNDSVMLPNLNSATNDNVPPAPWTLFPYLETEPGGHRGHLHNFPSDEMSGSRTQPRHHQPSLRLEVPDDELQALGANIEGRHRLFAEMRQILSALRRGENFNAEDYMLVDPYINGVADLHDRHRDMRLDVDNMSYEELLALEERIGDVKTGLTEDAVLKSLKQRKYFSFMAIAGQHTEPCSICQEEYENGDDVGTLDCGHEFHTCCIKQWLTQKNLCPICKMTGLPT